MIAYVRGKINEWRNRERDAFTLEGEFPLEGQRMTTYRDAMRLCGAVNRDECLGCGPGELILADIAFADTPRRDGMVATARFLRRPKGWNVVVGGDGRYEGVSVYPREDFSVFEGWREVG